MVSVSDTQRHALDGLAARTGRTTSQLAREALDLWLATQPHESWEEVAPAG